MTEQEKKAAALRDSDDESTENLEAASRLWDAVMRKHMEECPQEIIESLERYRDDRIPTGGFLRAVLENDLRNALSRADNTNVVYLLGIVKWIYWNIPAIAWGSPKNVSAWLQTIELP